MKQELQDENTLFEQIVIGVLYIFDLVCILCLVPIGYNNFKEFQTFSNVDMTPLLCVLCAQNKGCKVANLLSQKKKKNNNNKEKL